MVHTANEKPTTSLQKEDLRNLLSFLDLKEHFQHILFPDNNIEKNLKVKTGNAYGLTSVMQFLCQQGDYSKTFLGMTPEEKALTRQWMEYNVPVLGCSTSSSSLKELDMSLRSFTYFSGSIPTLADFFIYIRVHSTMKQLNFHDKELYPNLCRWFRLIQECEGIRGSRGRIIFSRTSLY